MIDVFLQQELHQQQTAVISGRKTQLSPVCINVEIVDNEQRSYIAFYTLACFCYLKFKNSIVSISSICKISTLVTLADRGGQGGHALQPWKIYAQNDHFSGVSNVFLKFF